MGAKVKKTYTALVDSDSTLCLNGGRGGDGQGGEERADEDGEAHFDRLRLVLFGCWKKVRRGSAC